MKTSANRPASTPAPSLDGGQVARLLRPGFALAVLGLAQLLDVLDLTIVTTALPSMKVNLHMGSASSAWIIDACALTYGSLLIFAGRLGDSLGRRRVFLAGATLFGVASLAGGLAANGLMLIIARAAQGAGGALSSACVLAILTSSFPEGRERTRALGVYAAVSGVGASLGLLLGGALTQAGSWRLVMFVSIPIVLLLLALAPRALPRDRGTEQAVDAGSAIGLTGSLALLIYGLLRASGRSFGDPITLS